MNQLREVMGESMRILIVDDHRIVADSISTYLTEARGFDVEAAVDLSSGIAAMAGERAFDAILLDVVLPGSNGLATVSAALDAAGDVPVIIFSGNASDDLVRKALDLGAQGYIPKSFPLKSLSTAIELVVNGQRFVPADFANRAAATDRTYELGLSPRELAVLRGIADGKTNKVMAFELGCTEASVKMHVRSICQKLDAQNRAHAVVKGKELAII